MLTLDSKDQDNVKLIGFVEVSQQVETQKSWENIFQQFTVIYLDKIAG